MVFLWFSYGFPEGTTFFPWEKSEISLRLATAERKRSSTSPGERWWVFYAANATRGNTCVYYIYICIHIIICIYTCRCQCRCMCTYIYIYTYSANQQKWSNITIKGIQNRSNQHTQLCPTRPPLWGAHVAVPRTAGASPSEDRGFEDRMLEISGIFWGFCINQSCFLGISSYD